MAKEVMTIIKLQVPAGGANPSPPVGPALGQHGLNIMDFCNAFNEKTKEVEKGLKVPVEITVFEDRTFTFITKSPPASILLKKAASIPKGSGEPNRTKVARISRCVRRNEPKDGGKYWSFFATLRGSHGRKC